MLTPVRGTVAPSPGLIAALATATWIDTDPNGEPVCCVVIVHRTPRSPYETPAVVESRMRQVATSLLLSAADHSPAPEVGPRVRPIGHTDVALRFEGTPYRKRIPADTRWVRLVREQHSVALVLGLDPLSRGAKPAEIDAYLDASAAGRRLLFGRTCAE